MRSSTTTKGLVWEVLLPVLRWPMRSPLRLFGTLAVLAFVILGLARIDDMGDPSTEAKASEASSSSSSTSSSSPLPADPELDQQLNTTAVDFVTVWARPDLSAEKWSAGIESQHPDESFAQALGQTDPANIPATRVTGTAHVIERTEDEARVEVPTDGPVVEVIVIRSEEHAGAWVVGNIFPADEAESSETTAPTAG